PKSLSHRKYTMNNSHRLAICLLGFFAVLFAPASSSGQPSTKSERDLLLDSLYEMHLSEAVLLAVGLDSLPNPDSLSADEVMVYAFQLADEAVNLENIFIQNAHRATASRQAREAEIDLLKQDSTSTKEQVSELKLSLKELKATEKQAFKQRKQAG